MHVTVSQNPRWGLQMSYFVRPTVKNTNYSVYNDRKQRKALKSHT